MDCLVVRLCGPMQSWGTQSRFRIRDSEHEPTKSGIIGMMAAALGMDRKDPLGSLTSLLMAVRVDREGVYRQEFQTALDVVTASGSVAKDPQLSYRNYLSDADFTTCLAGDRTLIDAIHYALLHPQRPLFLGRKSYVPSAPLTRPGWVFRDTEPTPVLLSLPLRRDNPCDTERVRLVIPDDGTAGEQRQDEPISFAIGAREFRTRYVHTTFRPVSEFSLEGIDVSQ